MYVPFFDASQYHARLLPSAEELFRRVFSAGQAILGTEVKTFEQEAAEFLGVRYAIGVSSGTDAIVCALVALGVEPGDAVLTTPFSFFATAEAISRTGARPVFCDVDENTYNWSEASLATAASDIRAVVAVHLFGRISPMAALARRFPRAALIEDAAQAFGAELDALPLDGKCSSAGSLGDAGCFSFFPTKPLGALGDGGLVVTQHAAVAARCRELRVHGASAKYVHATNRGGNYRLDEIQAGLLRLKLPEVRPRRERRRAIAALYSAGLSDVPELSLPQMDDPGHAWSVYTLRVLERRAELVAQLKRDGIECVIYYPLAVHLQPALRELGYGPGDFPVAERLSQQALALPIFPELTDELVSWVIERVRVFFGAA